jgi:hypothetical protein
MIFESLIVAFLLMLILLMTAIIMLSANEYILNTEVYFNKNKSDFLRYLNVTIKILTKNITNKKQDTIDAVTFISNLFTLTITLTPIIYLLKLNYGGVSKIPSDEIGNFYLYYPLFSVLIVFLSRLMSYIALDYRLDINKIITKGYISLSLYIFNFCFTFWIIKSLNYNLLTYIKFFIFINSVIAIYMFDHYTKFKKSEKIFQKKMIDKLMLVIILLSLFIFLNKSEELLLKLPYYLISIVLIDFISIYVKKSVGHFKLEQLQKLNFRIVFVYYILTNSILMLVNYVV